MIVSSRDHPYTDVTELDLSLLPFPVIGKDIRNTLQGYRLLHLSMRQCGLLSLDTRPFLPHLLSLDLEHNQLPIKALSQIGKSYPRLISLLLFDNFRIAEKSELKTLAKLKVLKELSIGQPDQDTEPIRKWIFQQNHSIIILNRHHRHNEFMSNVTLKGLLCADVPHRTNKKVKL